MNHRPAARTLLAAGLAFPHALGLGVADAKLARSGDARVEFSAEGSVPGVHVNGRTADLTVAEDAQAIALRVPLAHLETGIGLRDRYMREEYLEVEKYPTATLRVARSDLRLEGGEGDATGTIDLHGHSKPVRVHYVVRKNGTSLEVSGAFHIDIREFGMQIPSYLGVSVKPGVGVIARFTARAS